MQFICFHFQLNQPLHLKTYRFFDINQDHDYFDHFQNRYITQRLSDRSYLPANNMLLKLIKEFGSEMACSFNIAGTSLLLFEKYRPDIIESFQALLKTGSVELTGGTLTYSLASLHNKACFLEQIQLQEKLLKRLFDYKPKSFFNTECIYSDEIGEWIHDAGYRIALTEGAEHILGWKSPGYIYCNPYQTDLKLMLRNYSLSEDIEFRFGKKDWDQYPLTAEKFMGFIKTIPADIPFINIYIDYETIGEFYTADTGIFDFFYSLFSQIAMSPDYTLIKPTGILSMDIKPATLHVPWPISSSGDEKGVSEWLGNELQQDAFQQLFKLENLYHTSSDENAKRYWLELQAAEHFDYMATHWFPKKAVQKNFEVYSSPYHAFINFMNIVNDMELQLSK